MWNLSAGQHGPPDRQFHCNVNKWIRKSSAGTSFSVFGCVCMCVYVLSVPVRDFFLLINLFVVCFFRCRFALYPRFLFPLSRINSSGLSSDIRAPHTYTHAQCTHTLSLSFSKITRSKLHCVPFLSRKFTFLFRGLYFFLSYVFTYTYSMLI